MFALISLLVVISLSMLVIRVGTLALMMTGMSEDAARFQSLSAFSGAGFTTGEAEMVVNVPERRRIISRLIEVGSAGVITAISSLILSFTSAGELATQRLLILVIGVVILALLSRSKGFNRILTPAIQRALRRTTSLEVRDYAGLLRLHDDYSVAELEVNENDWLASARLADLNLPAEGVLVLGILRRDGTYNGVPGPDTRLEPGDIVIAYGQTHRLRELASRPATDVRAHEEAMVEHELNVRRCEGM
ncbi:TrkA C-terminal domain-containing protein [Rhodocaloribacter sp.]